MDEAMLQSLPFVIEKSPYARDSNPWHYEAIFMSDEVDSTYRLRETVTVEGMGIPLAGLGSGRYLPPPREHAQGQRQRTHADGHSGL